MERAGLNFATYLFEYLFPSGWVYQNRVSINQDSQEMIAEIDVPNHYVDVARIDAHEKRSATFSNSPYTFLTHIFFERR